MPRPVATPAQVSSKGKPPSFRLTLKQHAILVLVYKHQMLTNEQLCRALGLALTSLTEVHRLTKPLRLLGFLVFMKKGGSEGRAPFVYMLSRKGLSYLKRCGFDAGSYLRLAKDQAKSDFTLLHTLSLNDVLIAVSQLDAISKDFYLHAFVHDRILKRTPYYVSCLWGKTVERVAMIADAFLDIRCRSKTGHESEIPVLLELDRNTEERKVFQQQTRARISFIQDEGFKSMFDRSTITFAYAIAQGGEKRLSELLKWSRKELASTSEPSWLSRRFLFSLLPVPVDPKRLFCEPVWYQPFAVDSPVALLEHALRNYIYE